MRLSIDWWNDNKMWIAPPVAVLLWAVSMVCFIFGLSFKNPIVVAGADVSLYLAGALALSNTAIQIIGNDQDYTTGDKGVFFWIWIASYALGISSNANTLLQIIGMQNKFLEWTVSIALGAIIEIAPEKLLVMWLRSLKKKPTPAQPQHEKSQYIPQHKPNNPMPNFRPSNNQPKPRQNQPFPPKTNPMPVYHPIAMQGRPEMEDTDKDF